MEIHPSARKHGIADQDIEHAVRHAVSIDHLTENRILDLGPARSAELLEVVTMIRDDGSGMAIDAMPMRRRYERILAGD